MMQRMEKRSPKMKSKMLGFAAIAMIILLKQKVYSLHLALLFYLILFDDFQHIKLSNIFKPLDSCAYRKFHPVLLKNVPNNYSILI